MFEGVATFRQHQAILHHGTTLKRAREIEANGPDPDYREPGTTGMSSAEGFSTVIGDGRACSTGIPDLDARNKASLFPDEGGPAILEVSVPAWIMAILYSDTIAAALARSGEIRFETRRQSKIDNRFAFSGPYSPVSPRSLQQDR